VACVLSLPGLLERSRFFTMLFPHPLKRVRMYSDRLTAFTCTFVLTCFRPVRNTQSPGVLQV
jgi:hypothetical protein